MKRKYEAVDQENLTVEQTWARHETRNCEQCCFLDRSEQQTQKQEYVKWSFVIDPVEDDRERSLMTLD